MLIEESVAKRSMRILEVTESFATGTMEVVRLVSEGAAREGHRVGIAYGERPETPQDVGGVVAGEIDLISLPWTERTLGMQARATPALHRLGRQWKPDIVHLHSSFAGLIGTISIGSFAPTVYTPHGYSFLGASSRARAGAYRLAERAIARRVTMIGAVSEHEARLARGLGARRVEVVPNGIPELDGVDEFVGSKAPSQRPAVVAAGRIVPARRPLATARILTALAGVAEISWIGGAGPDPGLAEQVRRLGVPVTGWLPRDVAVRRLSEAMVLLQWSAWDSHPLTVLEALAADVIVVGSDIEANRDVLGEGQVRGTEDEVEELIRELIEDPQRRQTMLVEQRRRRGRYSATRMIDDWLRIYAGLVAEGGASAVPAGRELRA